MIEINSQQSYYNMLGRNSSDYCHNPLEYKTEKEILPLVREYGQAFLPYSPLFQGLLTGTFKKGKNFSDGDIRNENPRLVGPDFDLYYDVTLKLGEIADKMGKPMNEMAFNWLRQKTEVTSIIEGASSVKQLDGNVHSTTWDIPEDIMEEINHVIEPFENL